MVKVKSKKKAPSSNGKGKRISNRRARFDYELGDSLVAGLSLTGSEVRALRAGRGNLTGAFVTVRGEELWLVNATITALPGTALTEADQTRSRKLLAKKREIQQFIAAKQEGRTIVPLEILTSGRYIKIRLAAGRGRRKYDKRQVLKQRDENRDMRAALN